MKNEIITKLEAHVVSECSAIDREKRFDAMMDECYSFKDVGGPFEWMQPSSVLKEMDPTAYRCGVNDYEDSEQWVEIDGEYYEQREAEKAKEDFKDELSSEISDLEIAVEEAEEDLALSTDGVTLQTVAELKRKLASMQADLETVENHSF